MFTVGFSTHFLVTSVIGLEENAEFTFLVNKYLIDFQYNDFESKIETFSIAGSEDIIPGSDEANFTIRHIESSSNRVIYDYIKGIYSHRTTITEDEVWNLQDTTSTEIPEEIEDIDMSNDLTNGTLPFILPVTGSNDSIWTKLDTEIFADYSDSAEQDGNTASVTIKSDITDDRFEVVAEASISIDVSGTKLELDLEVEIIYEIETGVLLGYKSYMVMDAVLPSEGVTTYLKLDAEIVREDFSFGKPVPGFEYTLSVFIFILLGCLSIVTSRGRKK